MKNIHTFALLALLTVLAGCRSKGGAKTDAPDGFYVGTDITPNYTLHVFPPKGERGVGITSRIRQSNAFLPQNVRVSATDQIPGGYLVQASGEATEEMLDLSGIIIVENHNAYFGDGKRVGSSAMVSLLLDNREEADAIAAMLRKYYSLAPSATNFTPVTSVGYRITDSNNWQTDQTKTNVFTEALARAEKEREKRLLGIPPPASQFPFPNFDTGPGRPLPIKVNFYSINDHYPNYLLCSYDVDESHYDRAQETGWFKAALNQIRRSGPEKFPPIKWIAVIIVNRAEWKGVETFEQAHKVGALFKASEVFDSSREFSQLLTRAVMDQHPFLYDQQQPTPGEQQRWVITERHAAANPTNSSEQK